MDWTKCLGKGTFGTVVPGTSRFGVPKLEVAIKICHGPTRTGQLRDCTGEMNRMIAVGPHPNIPKLLDVGLYGETTRTLPHIGLVYERFDVDARQAMAMRPFNLTGIRHVLQSTIAALGHIHGKGLVHADLKPGNILLRGAGLFRGSWFQSLQAASAAAGAAASASAGGGAEEPLEITYQVPACCQVRRTNLTATDRCVFHLQKRWVASDNVQNGPF